MSGADWQEGAERRHDDDGNPIVQMMTCGHCGQTWDNALITSRTPVPSGRCPFEYDHEYPEDGSTPFREVHVALNVATNDVYVFDTGEAADEFVTSMEDVGWSVRPEPILDLTFVKGAVSASKGM